MASRLKQPKWRSAAGGQQRLRAAGRPRGNAGLRQNAIPEADARGTRSSTGSLRPRWQGTSSYTSKEAWSFTGIWPTSKFGPDACGQG
jgi:hypothetical protein